MANRRKASIPFSLGSKSVRTLKDIQDILKNHPEDLILPAKDGRLKRFLQGFGKTYVDCLDSNNVQESIKRLAELFGVDVKDMDFSLDSNLALDNSKVIELLDKGEYHIEVSKGIFDFDKLYIDRPVRIIGQGKSETLIKVGVMCVASDGFTLENLTCECKYLITENDVGLSKDRTKFEYQKRYGFGDIIELIKKRFYFYEDLSKLKNEIRINVLNSLSDLKGKMGSILNKSETQNILKEVMKEIEREVYYNYVNLNEHLIFNKIKDKITGVTNKFKSTIDQLNKSINGILDLYLDVNANKLRILTLFDPIVVNDRMQEIKGKIKDTILKKWDYPQGMLINEYSIKKKIREILEVCKYYNEEYYNLSFLQDYVNIEENGSRPTFCVNPKL